MSHPMQELYTDEHDVIRFRENKIVRWLLDNNGKIDLNTIARQNFPNEEQEQFAQLIGYSLSGFGDLSYVSDVAWSKANIMLEEDNKNQKDIEIEALKDRIQDLESIVVQVSGLTYGVVGDQD